MRLGLHTANAVMVDVRAAQIKRFFSSSTMSSFLSSIRLIPEVAINYRVGQSKRTPGASFKFVVQQRFEISQNNARNTSEKSLSSKVVTCKIDKQHESSTLNRHRK